MEVYVLRLFHRRERDKRVTTHCALVARAFLAKKRFYCGDRDESLEDNIKDINKRFGGSFEIEYVKEWKKLLKDFSGVKIHLTMYGIPLLDKLDEIKKKEKILVIIGSEKVPREVYEISDYNISITNQPHSEIAALAIFLDKIFESKEFFADFENAKIKIIPSERNKKVLKIK
ncbi:MAG: tRNA (cytidine(56)-2'-O)-methyltransferase [Candidatus Aenigmatarchaeota archaeon]